MNKTKPFPFPGGAFPTEHLHATQNQANQANQYRDFKASELYCPKCKKSMPVREKMLLVVPGGDVFDYVCVKCGTSLGVRNTAPGSL